MSKRFIPFLVLIIVIINLIGCTQEDSITTLLADLQSPPQEITRKILAAKKLAELKDPEAIPYLIEALGDSNPQVRENIAATLVVYGQELPEETIPKLTEYLASDSSLIRTEIMEILAKIGKPAIPALRKALQSSNRSVRIKAIEVLGNIGDKSVIYDLVKILEETNEETEQMLCAISLAKLKSPAAIESLQKLINTSKSYDVKIQAIKAIGELQSKDSAVLLIKLLNNRDEKPGIKVEALKALKVMDIKSNDLKKSLEKLVESNNDKLRNESIYYLFTLGDHRAMKFLWEDVDEKYLAQAQQAVIVLGRTGDTSKGTINALKKATKFKGKEDDKETVETIKIIAAKSLVQCKDDDGRTIIIECLRSCQADGNKLLAIDYAAELGMKESVPILMELLRTSTDFGMIKTLLEALRQLDAKEAIPDMKDKYLTLGTQAELKIVIVEILAEFHSPEAKAAFEELLKFEKGKDAFFEQEIDKILKGW